MRWGVAVITLGCAALVGCGGPATSSESDRLHATVDAFRLACVRGDGIAVLETLTEAQRETFIEAPSLLEGCAEVAGLKATGEQTIREDLSKAEIEDISVHGDTAQATLAVPGGDNGKVDLEVVAAGWLVHSAVEG